MQCRSSDTGQCGEMRGTHGVSMLAARNYVKWVSGLSQAHVNLTVHLFFSNNNELNDTNGYTLVA